MAKPKKGSAGKPKAAAKAAPAKAKAAAKAKPKPKRREDVLAADPALFLPLSEGERADAVRTLLEDERVRAMAKVGRYRVITVEPLAVKPPDPLAGRRLARVVVYDYAADRCLDACVDLDGSTVTHAAATTAQPMLSPDEESQALAVATSDDRVRDGVIAGDKPIAVLHYWSRRQADVSYRRRSAAVVFGRGGSATQVAIVDLTDNMVADVVSAEAW